jgi:hypothetical protein
VALWAQAANGHAHDHPRRFKAFFAASMIALRFSVGLAPFIGGSQVQLPFSCISSVFWIARNVRRVAAAERSTFQRLLEHVQFVVQLGVRAAFRRDFPHGVQHRGVVAAAK